MEAAHRIAEPYRQEQLRQPDAAVRQDVTPSIGKTRHHRRHPHTGCRRQGRACRSCKPASTLRQPGLIVQRISPSMTATNCADDDSSASITAEDRPRRPIAGAECTAPADREFWLRCGELRPWCRPAVVVDEHLLPRRCRTMPRPAWQPAARRWAAHYSKAPRP